MKRTKMNLTQLFLITIIVSFFTFAFQAYDQYHREHSVVQYPTTKHVDKPLAGD